MQSFQNILFVSTGLSDEKSALTQAVTVARNNNAKLSVLVLYPKFPKNLAEYELKYAKHAVDDMRDAISSVTESAGVNGQDFLVSVESAHNEKPAIAIIQHVLKNDIDVVVKQAEQNDNTAGFKALDMNLLRQCPVPVWLCRAGINCSEGAKIAVAVDAESDTEEGRDLSIRLLKTAQNVAAYCHGTLKVVSCWRYEFEQSLRGNSWFKMEDHEMADLLAETETTSFTALQNLVQQSGLPDGVELYHLKGKPEQIIPEFMVHHGIDVLVMGTVARTGIQGFLIGNTAENILQNLSCSLLALKPNGFVTPVKIY